MREAQEDPAMDAILEIGLSVGVLVTLVTAITACICGCKNSNQKSELVGTAGIVKLRFDEETPSPTPTTPASDKRASTQNSHRSLPEIPHQVGRHDSGDTASEIYATVNLDEGTKLTAGAEAGGGAGPARREHPYEHAYAQLQQESHATVERGAEAAALDPPIDEREHAAPESVVISASVAISGQLPSSQELPYITPPRPDPRDLRDLRPDHQQHFSGDSTDSTKGYTSISVREPLSNIRRQPTYAPASDGSDEMYCAIEDGSRSDAGEATSETYAQIAPAPPPPAAPPAPPGPAGPPAPPAPPAPPGPPGAERGRSAERDSRALLVPVDVNPRRSAPPEVGAGSSSSHSRQASSSSCAPGSPKPEKRQANSPLPPTPRAALRQHRISSTGDLHISHDKVRRSLNEKHQRNNSCVSSSDFYGCNYPVPDPHRPERAAPDAHRMSAGDVARTLQPKELIFTLDRDPNDNLYNSIEPGDPADSPAKTVEEMYAKVMKKVKGQEKRKSKELTAESAKKTDDPGYETIDRRHAHGYESIAPPERARHDPDYETVKEVLKPRGKDSGPGSLAGSDPGYEHIRKTSDPHYEVLRNTPPTPPYATIAGGHPPAYSTVHKKADAAWNNNDDAAPEPNYESMPHEPPYATGSESDPNYESVRPDPGYGASGASDPNYESLRHKDPKYESVRSKASARSKDPNYESVKYFDVSASEPPYERVGAAPDVRRSDSAAGYERVGAPREPRPGVSNGADATVSDYFQV